MKDLLTALIAVWLILSVLLFAVAVTPFVAGADHLAGLLPVCEAKKRGESCILCGMTTAYLAIGRTDFASAQTANRGGLLLWSASILNFLAAAAYVWIVRRRRPRDWRL